MSIRIDFIDGSFVVYNDVVSTYQMPDLLMINYIDGCEARRAVVKMDKIKGSTLLSRSTTYVTTQLPAGSERVD